jgi:hypothetical protein
LCFPWKNFTGKFIPLWNQYSCKANGNSKQKTWNTSLLVFWWFLSFSTSSSFLVLRKKSTWILEISISSAFFSFDRYHDSIPINRLMNYDTRQWTRWSCKLVRARLEFFSEPFGSFTLFVFRRKKKFQNLKKVMKGFHIFFHCKLSNLCA